MRLRINLRDEVVEELDRRLEPRRRTAFITRAIERALHDERRWAQIESALGVIPDSGHEWDDDPAGWVRQQRRGALAGRDVAGQTTAQTGARSL